MSLGWPAMLTGALNVVATLYFGLAIGKKNSYRTWSAFFIVLAVNSGIQFVNDHYIQSNKPAFWILDATTGTAAAFLFLSANLTVVKPNWRWLHWLWPLMGFLGLFIGGTLAPMPSYYTNTIILIAVIASLLILQKTSNKYARTWIYTGLLVRFLGGFISHFYHGSGRFDSAAENLIQFASATCLWVGARRT